MNIKEFAMKYFGLTLPRHQKSWLRWLDKAGNKCMLLAPRGHGKTTIINLVYLCWLIANDPKLHILLVSHSKEMAEAFSRSVRAIFEREDIQEDFGIEIGNPWRANSWTLKGSKDNKPTLRVVGAMGRMTGWRGDIVIFDDLLEINAVSSPATRKKIDNWIKSEVYPALNPGPKQRIIVVGTRKSIHDWYGELLEGNLFNCRVDKAFRLDGYPLWPEVFTKEKLAEIKELQGALYFAQEMMNEPSVAEGLVFKTEWLKFYENLPNGRYKWYMGIDPSHGSKSDRATYFSICVVAHNTESNKIYVVDMYRGKLTKHEQVMKAVSYADRYPIDAMYIENVFNYTHVFDGMRARYQNVFEIDYIHTQIKGTTAVKKEERIQNICQPAIETGRIFFMKPDLNKYIAEFLEYEYIAFPHGDMDMFDSLTLSIQHLVGHKIITEIPWYFPKSR